MAGWAVALVVVPFIHINLQNMVLLVFEVSLYANWASDFTNWQAARAEMAASSKASK